MWLNGYDVSLHRIYVGISKTAVSGATPNSQNTAGRFWMAATSSAEVRSSEVRRGDVWSFSTGDGDFTQQIEDGSSGIVLPF